MFAHRRGYPPSPPPRGRHDFEVDAEDLAPLLDGQVHLVAHSYGVLGAMIAAGRFPLGVRSLTLIEPPLYFLVPGDPDVAHLEALGEEIMTLGLQMDPLRLREFLRLAGAPVSGDEPLSDDVVRGVRRAHGGRPPGEARPDIAAIRDSRVASLVASGGHSPAIERICDALAASLGAERAVLPGAGHFVAAAPGFADRLELFLGSVDPATRAGPHEP
jgi:pimeloyl-ACP methyl ester carboxylesterase